jgi:hypothetical protein
VGVSNARDPKPVLNPNQGAKEMANAKIQMLTYSGQIPPATLQRLEAADEAVFGALTSNGNKNRCMWTETEGAVQLVDMVTRTVLYSTTVTELNGMEGDDLVGAVWHAIQQ